MRTQAALPGERQEGAGRERPQGCPRPGAEPPGSRGPSLAEQLIAPRFGGLGQMGLGPPTPPRQGEHGGSP